MARTTGPLLSMDASGSVGDALTFAKWKGRNYVRRYAIPANPRSVAQVSIRAGMQYYTSVYKENTGLVEANFGDQAQSLKISPFNAFTRAGLKAWKSSILVWPENYEVSPAESSALFTLTGTVQPRGITWDWATTYAGTVMGWILTVREAADPGTSLAYAVFGSANAVSYTLTGLKPATTYHARIHVTTAEGSWGVKSAAVTATTA